MSPSELRDPDRLWQRVREGLATAVLGRLPDPPADLHLLRVSCEVAPAALRPLLEARRLTEAVLGDRKPEKAKSVRRRTLFGDAPERATEAVVVELWNELARQKGVRWLVVFDAVEQADDATLAALTQVVRRAGWLQLPLVLVFHGDPRDGAAELLAAVRARDERGVLTGEAPPSGDASAIQWRTLPPEVLRVLRAGALIGPGFETRIVADLLALEPLAVLERLQHATDLGVPLEDRGEGRFSLPTSALTALSASLMPSLAQAWHRKLGKLLGARAGEDAALAPRPTKPPLPVAARRRGRRTTVSEALAAEIIDLSAEAIDLSVEADEAVDASERVTVVDAPGAKDMSGGTGDPAGAKDMSGETGDRAGAKDGSGGSGERASAKDLSGETGDRAGAKDGSGGSGERASAKDLSGETGDRAGAKDGSAGDRAGAKDGSAGDLAGAKDGSAGDRAGAKDGSAGDRAGAKDMSAETAAADGRAAHAVVWSPTRRRTVLVQPALGEAEPEAAPVSWGEPSRVVPKRLDDPLVDEVRAAEHLRLAGDVDAAAQHLGEAARKAADMGAPQAAAQHANAALALLDTLPPSAARRQIRVQARMELGRQQWQSAGYELGFTLAQALATLEAARADLDPGAPVDLAAELAQAIAGVCFDLGDQASLERALAELESASARLTAAGDTTGAACLLNDQAAVLIRLGHPGRSLLLLRASRQAFEALAPDDPTALRELAETELLFARLPMHAQLRPGREQEGFNMGLEHALAAERAYHELGEARELGRVWETMGRLELRRGNVEPARLRLEAAMEVQTQLGDLTGLASTTEALSEVLALCGRDAEAVSLLRDSIVFNRDKGSPLGLIGNRRAFTALSARLAGQAQHAAGLQEAGILLTAGERELGVAASG